MTPEELPRRGAQWLLLSPAPNRRHPGGPLPAPGLRLVRGSASRVWGRGCVWGWVERARLESRSPAGPPAGCVDAAGPPHAASWPGSRGWRRCLCARGGGFCRREGRPRSWDAGSEEALSRGSRTSGREVWGLRGRGRDPSPRTLCGTPERLRGACPGGWRAAPPPPAFFASFELDPRLRAGQPLLAVFAAFPAPSRQVWGGGWLWSRVDETLSGGTPSYRAPWSEGGDVAAASSAGAVPPPGLGTSPRPGGGRGSPGDRAPLPGRCSGWK